MIMPESDPNIRVVFTTAASAEEARKLAHALVEEKLAACASLVPAAESVYRWEGTIETASETLLILKTAAERVEALKVRLHELHGYRTPEFLVLAVESGSDGYLEWVAASVRGG